MVRIRYPAATIEPTFGLGERDLWRLLISCPRPRPQHTERIPAPYSLETVRGHPLGAGRSYPLGAPSTTSIPTVTASPAGSVSVRLIGASPNPGLPVCGLSVGRYSGGSYGLRCRPLKVQAINLVGIPQKGDLVGDLSIGVQVVGGVGAGCVPARHVRARAGLRAPSRHAPAHARDADVTHLGDARTLDQSFMPLLGYPRWFKHPANPHG